ncbi:MAG: hypothetical protein GXP30_05660 [Verrucomicrobia bacterium]|nr:hypothetical protein [Verrucomicrobiota bacterium]
MPEETILTHIPSLIATLSNKERAKGTALTREEVESIRDRAPARVLTREQRAAVDERREYDDIDPEQTWEHWQVARLELNSEDK